MATCYRHPDRETGLSCSECGRPICTECMTMAAVGIRCPDHSGQPQGVGRVSTGVRRAAVEGGSGQLTKALLGINVAVFVLAIATGGTIARGGGSLHQWGALWLPGLLQDEWWRLITAAFFHYGLFHLGMNMLILYLIGTPLEMTLGRARYVAIYFVAILGGSAGALLLSPPNVMTAGASGAVFGIFGAAIVLERQGVLPLGGSIVGLVIFNLIITFTIPGISVGGHLGGFAGGALGMLALSRFGRVHGVYGRPGPIGFGGIALVGLLSLALAVLQVQRYA